MTKLSTNPSPESLHIVTIETGERDSKIVAIAKKVAAALLRISSVPA